MSEAETEAEMNPAAGLGEVAGRPCPEADGERRRQDDEDDVKGL